MLTWVISHKCEWKQYSPDLYGKREIWTREDTISFRKTYCIKREFEFIFVCLLLLFVMLQLRNLTAEFPSSLSASVHSRCPLQSGNNKNNDVYTLQYFLYLLCWFYLGNSFSYSVQDSFISKMP